MEGEARLLCQPVERGGPPRSGGRSAGCRGRAFPGGLPRSLSCGTSGGLQHALNGLEGRADADREFPRQLTGIHEAIAQGKSQRAGPVADGEHRRQGVGRRLGRAVDPVVGRVVGRFIGKGIGQGQRVVRRGREERLDLAAPGFAGRGGGFVHGGSSGPGSLGSLLRRLAGPRPAGGRGGLIHGGSSLLQRLGRLAHGPLGHRVALLAELGLQRLGPGFELPRPLRERRLLLGGTILAGLRQGLLGVRQGRRLLPGRLHFGGHGRLLQSLEKVVQALVQGLLTLH